MTDSAAFVLPVTWGSAWMTVSNRALIPVAIFNSFNTKTLHVNISQIAHASVYFCLTGGMRVFVCVCMPLVILRTLMMRMMVGLMGSEAFKSISSKVIPMMDNNTMARSSWFHLDQKKKNNKTKQNHPTHIYWLYFLHCYVCGCRKEDSEYLSLKNRRRPKAMSLRIASMTKTTVKT